MMRMIIAVLISCAAIYAMHAFIIWQADPGEWSMDARYSMIILCCLLGGLSALFTKSYEGQ